jgi:RNA recognition motif-containing protein
MPSAVTRGTSAADPAKAGLTIHVAAVTRPKGVRSMGKKLYVGNLSFGVSDKELETLFSQAGKCESATVIMDRNTGQSRGFGFVEMSSNAEAQKAIQQLDGQELQGRTLKVSEAQERERRDGDRGWGRR